MAETNDRAIDTGAAAMQKPEQPTALYVANRGYALASSRLLLMKHLLSRGWRVVAATAPDEHADRLAAEGVIIEPVIFDRGGFAPYRDAKSFFKLIRINRKYRPELVHQFHAKPLILGTAASRLFPNVRIVNTVTGLGHAFIEGGIAHHLSRIGYRFTLRRSDATIFLNRDDQKLFFENGWTTDQKSRLIIGSGVDTARFAPPERTEPGHPPRVLMVARLLWQKGVREFLEAAEIVKSVMPEARLQLAGEWDATHPDAVPPDVIDDAVSRGLIEFLGYIENIEDVLQTASLFVLPSYREGVPRVIMEASACAVPVVAFDVPGCREVVTDGETGFLVATRNSRALAESILSILRNPQIRERMGKLGRERVEKDFDVHAITARTLDVYRELGLSV